MSAVHNGRSGCRRVTQVMCIILIKKLSELLIRIVSKVSSVDRMVNSASFRIPGYCSERRCSSDSVSNI